MDIVWEAEHVEGGGENIVAKMARKLVSDEAAIKTWAPALLKMELDRVLWKEADHIQIKRLWEFLCSYCYLPRLSCYGVLEDAIQRGLGSKEYFGLAAGFSDDRYMELTFGEQKAFINESDLLVKPAVATRQIEEEEAAARAAAAEAEQSSDGGGHGIAFGPTTSETVTDGTGRTTVVDTTPVVVQPARQKTSFHMTAKLDNTRVNRNIQTIMDEVVSQLNMLGGADVQLSFSVSAHVEDGIPVQTVRAISENCSTLGINDYRFGE